MPQWSRGEIDEAFAHYQDVSARAASSGSWDEWAELFTDDVTYVEHLYGEMHGRDEVRRWITETMSNPPGSDMEAFPVEWHVVDEERGWVIFSVWNRMRDPGDGSVHQAANISILHYAGGGRWAYEEDVYNPARFATMIDGWEKRRAQLATPEG